MENKHCSLKKVQMRGARPQRAGAYTDVRDRPLWRRRQSRWAFFSKLWTYVTARCGADDKADGPFSASYGRTWPPAAAQATKQMGLFQQAMDVRDRPLWRRRQSRWAFFSKLGAKLLLRVQTVNKSLWKTSIACSKRFRCEEPSHSGRERTRTYVTARCGAGDKADGPFSAGWARSFCFVSRP